MSVCVVALEMSLLVQDKWEEVLQQCPVVNSYQMIPESSLMRIHGYLSKSLLPF